MSSAIQERLEYRKKEFKRGIDTEKSRRKREDESNSIRKNKRSENLQKRRRRNDHPSPRDGSVPSKILEDDPIDPKCVKSIYSDNTVMALDGLKYVRKIISDEVDPKIGTVVSMGIVPKLVEYLTYVQYPDHQYEAAWILTNMVSGKSKIAQPIIERTQIGPYMLELMKQINNKALRIQAIWCLSNIAGESTKYRDAILQQRGLEILLCILDHEISYEKRDIYAIRMEVWALSNFLRFSPSPPFTLMIKALPVVMKLYRECSDIEARIDAGWILSYISRGATDEELSVFLSMNIITPSLIDLLKDDIKVALPILRMCGNLIAGTDDVAQKVLDNGFLQYLPRFFTCSKRSSIIKEACWILSNITAGTIDQIQSVIKANLIPMVNVLMRNGKWDVKKECIYVYANLVTGGTHGQIDYLVFHGGINALCSMLCFDNPTNIIKMVLDTIHRILNGKKHINSIGYQQYCDMVEEQGLDAIERLQNHKNEKIYKKAVKIIERHFQGREMEVTEVEDTIGWTF